MHAAIAIAHSVQAPGTADWVVSVADAAVGMYASDVCGTVILSERKWKLNVGSVVEPDRVVDRTELQRPFVSAEAARQAACSLRTSPRPLALALHPLRARACACAHIARTS